MWIWIILIIVLVFAIAPISFIQNFANAVIDLFNFIASGFLGGVAWLLNAFEGVIESGVNWVANTVNSAFKSWGLDKPLPTLTLPRVSFSFRLGHIYLANTSYSPLQWLAYQIVHNSTIAMILSYVFVAIVFILVFYIYSKVRM